MNNTKIRQLLKNILAEKKTKTKKYVAGGNANSISADSGIIPKNMQPFCTLLSIDLLEQMVANNIPLHYFYAPNATQNEYRIYTTSDKFNYEYLEENNVEKFNIINRVNIEYILMNYGSYDKKTGNKQVITACDSKILNEPCDKFSLFLREYSEFDDFDVFVNSFENLTSDENREVYIGDMTEKDIGWGFEQEVATFEYGDIKINNDVENFYFNMKGVMTGLFSRALPNLLGAESLDFTNLQTTQYIAGGRYFDEVTQYVIDNTTTTPPADYDRAKFSSNSVHFLLSQINDTAKYNLAEGITEGFIDYLRGVEASNLFNNITLYAKVASYQTAVIYGKEYIRPTLVALDDADKNFEFNETIFFTNDPINQPTNKLNFYKNDEFIGSASLKQKRVSQTPIQIKAVKTYTEEVPIQLLTDEYTDGQVVMIGFSGEFFTVKKSDDENYNIVIEFYFQQGIKYYIDFEGKITRKEG